MKPKPGKLYILLRTTILIDIETGEKHSFGYHPVFWGEILFCIGTYKTIIMHGNPKVLCLFLDMNGKSLWMELSALSNLNEIEANL